MSLKEITSPFNYANKPGVQKSRLNEEVVFALELL